MCYIVCQTLIHSGPMKTSLSHLPPLKQQELQEIVQLMRQCSDIEMAILFGSYARGDWVEEHADDGVHFKYQSDIDLLAVVRTRNRFEQERLELKIKKAVHQLSYIKTPVSLIVHDIDFINRRLADAQYFFSDIRNDGVLLYDSEKYQLSDPKELLPQERGKLAQEDFDYWVGKAQKFMSGFQFYLSNHDYSEAAFLLHQITEKLYTAILLVMTHYKPNTHNLQKLKELVGSVDPQFIKIFSLNNAQEERCFDLLCKAYIDARYKKDYAITHEELVWLFQQVEKLMRLTETLCQQKIHHFLAGTA